MNKLVLITAAAAIAGCCSAPETPAKSDCCAKKAACCAKKADCCAKKQPVVVCANPACTSLQPKTVPFKLGMARYTMRGQKFDQAIETIARLDCHYMGLIENSIAYTASDAEIAAYKAKLAKLGIEVVSAGPLYYNDEATLKACVEFAKRYGMKYISVVPREENPAWKKGMPARERWLESDKMLDLLDAYVKKYDIKAAIHNHGPDNAYLYPTAEAAMKRIGNRDKRIGVCLDVGHERRAGLDPVEFIKKNADRIYEVHLKNINVDPVKNIAMEGPRGELDVKGIVKALADVGFDGYALVEYEKGSVACDLALAETFGYFRGVMDTTAAKAKMAPVPAGANTLTAQEKAEGYQLLFDGKNLPTDLWVGEKEGFKCFPKKGWYVEDGALFMKPVSGISPDGKWFPLPPEDARLGGGGSIVTVKKYKDFCFKFDFRLTWAANSGVKYYYDETVNNKGTCEEFQVLDAGHPDSSKGKDGNRRVASLYDLIPAHADKIVKPTGQWNSGMIIAKGNHVEHWLNGVKVVEYERGSAEFRKIVAGSKYATWGKDKDGKPQPWGEVPVGRIHIQDHSDSTAYFCNLKIKEL